MSHYDWAARFHALWDKAVAAYRAGHRQPAGFFSPGETGFLKSIGCSPQEIYDFVEDFSRGGEPDFDTVLLVTAVRRDYFLTVQKGVPSGRVVDMDALPPKDAELAGLAWLPRIIEKARAKLRGEMPPELMYGCGGDRPFLESVDVHPADFLRVVWAAGDDRQRIVDYVLARKAAKASRRAG
jgi:hypothetical protein